MVLARHWDFFFESISMSCIIRKCGCFYNVHFAHLLFYKLGNSHIFETNMKYLLSLRCPFIYLLNQNSNHEAYYRSFYQNYW